MPADLPPNPFIPEEVREDALRKVLRVGTPSLTQANSFLLWEAY